MLLKASVGVAVLVARRRVFAGDPHFKRYRVPSESMEPDDPATARRSTSTAGTALQRRRRRDLPPAAGRRGARSSAAQAAGRRVSRAPTGQRSQRDPTFIKRIVAGPGDGIAFETRPRGPSTGSRRRSRIATRVRRTGVRPPATRSPSRPACYFMVGDNRGASDDSRFWGPVPRTGSSGASSAAARSTSSARRSNAPGCAADRPRRRALARTAAPRGCPARPRTPAPGCRCRRPSPGGAGELVLAEVAVAARHRGRVAARLALGDPLEHRGGSSAGAPSCAGDARARPASADRRCRRRSARARAGTGARRAASAGRRPRRP